MNGVEPKDLFYVSIILFLLFINVGMYINVTTLLDKYNELSLEYDSLDREYRELLGAVMDIRRLNGSIDIDSRWDVNWWIVGVAYDGTSLTGMVVDFMMSVRLGSGRVYIDLNTPIGLDVQESLIIAKYVVSSSLDVDLDRYDIILRIDAPDNAAAVDGPSAGLALALAMASVFEDGILLEGVCVTGSLNIYGYVEKVGGILEKSLACVERGIDTILVPMGQSRVTIMVERTMEIFPGLSIRTTVEEEVELIDYLYEMYGYEVDVYEVGSFEDALSLLSSLYSLKVSPS